MKTALIVTLGTRDIQLVVSLKEINPGLYNERGFPLARKLGEFLLDSNNFKNYQGDISYPIVSPALEYVINEHDIIDTLILIVIDQDKSESGFYDNDSAMFGKVFQERIIPQSFNKSKDSKKINNITIERATKNVATLDFQYSHWQKQIKGSKVFKEISEFDKIYLCNQGGIDAVNNALLINSLDFFGEKLTILSVNEKTSLCTKLQFTNQYLKKTEERRLLNYLSSYNYAAAKSIKLSNKNITLITEYAEQRLNFNFKKCQSIVNELSVEHTDYKTQLLIELRNIQNDESGFLRELYINAKIKYHQEAYIDFLLRFFRIVEQVAKDVAFSKLGFTFNYEKWSENITDYLAKDENNGLKELLQKSKYNGNKLDYTKAVIPVFIEIVKYYNPEYVILDKIQNLAVLRNKSIGAHGFQPVSKDLIENELAQNNFSIQEMFEHFDNQFDIKENPFDRINQEIKALL